MALNRRHFAREMQINSVKFKVNGELLHRRREDWIVALKPGYIFRTTAESMSFPV